MLFQNKLSSKAGQHILVDFGRSFPLPSPRLLWLPITLAACPCSICVLCACFQIVICILAPVLKDDLLQEIIHVVLADLMILFLCSAKLVSCALKPNRAGADIDISTKSPPPPPHYT